MPACLNCGAPLDGRFCGQCGQRVLPPRPTLRELTGDAIAELVGWDGKVAATLRLLFSSPGELPRAFLDGRRARYISPLRLYLACSVLFFLVDAGAPTPDVQAELGFSAGVSVDARTDEVSPADAALTKAFGQGIASLTAEERAVLDAEIDTQPSWMRPLSRRLAEDPQGVERRINELLPRAFFVLIPGLALALAIFFRRRHFPEHLYVALHVQTVFFLAMTLATVVQYYSGAAAVLATAAAIAALTASMYAVAALRCVYGGGWAVTTLKAVGVAVIYGVLYSTATAAVLVWATRA